jgi:hypothetical protein
MLRLLKDLTTDTREEVGHDNPLRQVIVNTHSPAVVSLVEDADLLVAEPCEVSVGDRHCRAVSFSWLEDTWRHAASPDKRTLSRGKLRYYLNPLAVVENMEDEPDATATKKQDKNTRRRHPRVKDRRDLQRLLPNVSWSGDE